MKTRTTPLMRVLAEGRAATDIVALGAEGEPIAWRMFHADVAGLCAGLGNLAGGRWLVAEADAYRLIVGVLAVLHAGGVPVLPANLEAGHLREIAAAADGDVAEVRAGEALPSNAPALPPISAVAPEIVLYTSGTTGRPTALVKPVACLDAEVQGLEAAFGDRVAGHVFATVPPYHIYGLLFRVLWPIATGRCLAAATVQYPEEIVGLAADIPLGVLVSSPAFLKRVEAVLDVDRLRAAETQVFSSGGPLPPAVAADYNGRLAKPVIEVYGSTETGGIGYRSVLDADNPAPWSRFQGVALEADPETAVLSVRSPYIPGDAPFVTGDRVRFLDGDRFELMGRVDRIVKIEERRISLTEVEQRLSTRSEIARVRVVPLQGEGGRQFLGAVAQPTETGWRALEADGKRALTEALIASLRPFVAAVAVPRRWRFVRALPEDTRGKTTDDALRGLFAPDAARVTRPTVLEQTVDADSALLRLRFPSDLVFFDGHFDAVPILPGVAQLGMAIEFGNELFPVRADPSRIEALKFFNVLAPEREASLELAYDPASSVLRFRFFDGDTTFSAGRIVCGRAT